MFLTIWNPFGLVWTLLGHFKRKMIFCSKAPSPNPTFSSWGKKLIFVWNGLQVSRWAQKGPKLSKTSRFSISDPFGSLWNTLECWQACHVWPFLFVLLVRFFGHPVGKTHSRQDQTLPDKPDQTAKRPMVTQTFAQFTHGGLITKIMFYFFLGNLH